MSGYCPDCGNTICLCADIKAESDRINRELAKEFNILELIDFTKKLQSKLAEAEKVIDIVSRIPEEYLTNRTVRRIKTLARAYLNAGNAADKVSD